jgi:predicted ATPase
MSVKEANMATDPDDTTDYTTAHRKPPFLRRVRIRNFKSIKFCDVTLEPLTVLVGRNGSGKSNFVEALAFLRDVVTWGTEKSVNLHGGPTVKYRTDHEPVSIEVEYEAKSGSNGAGPGLTPFRYRIDIIGVHDRPQMSRETRQNLLNGGTDLPNEWVASSKPQQVAFLSLYQAEARPIQSILDYNFNPAVMRRPQRDVAHTLARDGANVAHILGRIKQLKNDGLAYSSIQQYLSIIVDDIEDAEKVPIGDYDTVRFRMRGDGGFKPHASSMSDGTLRVLATLVAAYQSDSSFGPPSLVAIEEPETALHPAAMHALVDALDQATGRTQILLTTHSAELLDNPTIRPENVRVVEMVNGETVITTVDEASVEIVQRQLDTLGGLERQNQLALNDDDRDRQKALAGAEAK